MVDLLCVLLRRHASQLVLNTAIDFLAMNADFFRCGNSKSYLIATSAKNCDLDFIADYQSLAEAT